MQGSAVSMIAEQRAALLGALATVGPGGWDVPTPCAPWTLKDLVAHLVDGELHVGRVVRGEIDDLGRVDPEEGIQRWRALPGEAVRAALWQHGSATQRVFESMDAARWSAPIRAFGCTSVGRLVRLHLFEGIIHGQDVAHTLGLGPIWADRIGYAAEFVLRAAPATLTRRGVPARGAVTIDAGDGPWLLRGEPSAGSWEIGRGEQDGDRLTIDPAHLVMTVTGRRPIEDLDARIDGDRAAVLELLRGWQVLAPGPA